MKFIIAHWKTSSIGLTMIGGTIIHLVFAVRSGNATEGVWTASLTAIVGGVGLMFAGDASASVQQSDVGTTLVTRDQAGLPPLPKPPAEPPKP